MKAWRVGKGKWTVRAGWLHALVLVYLLLFFPCMSAAGLGDGLKPVSGETQGGEHVLEENAPAPAVALTFDDGPSPTCTPLLLDGLKDRGVKATFFVVGENLESEEGKAIVARMESEGHLIGNHTYRHVDLSLLNHEEAKRELDMTFLLIRQATGKDTPWIRPPFGALPEGWKEEDDALFVKWTVDPLDWTTEDSGLVVDRVMAEVEEGDIILLHDCYKSSVEAALRIVDLLQEEGYRFVTVDELLME